MEQNALKEKKDLRRGILLDVDGTLWDAVEQITQAWNIYGEDLPDVTHRISVEEMRGCLGKTMFQIADILYGYLSQERRVEVLNGAMEYENIYLVGHPGRLYPKVRETFEKLREDGWHLYIVSNCQIGYIEDFLLAADAGDLIEDHLCFQDTMREKGYNIRMCADRNHLDYALYVGDTAGDLEAAESAGVDFIYAAYGFGSVEDTSRVKAAITSFEDLPGCVAGI